MQEAISELKTVYAEEPKTPSTQMRCPKCGGTEIEKVRQQEYRCRRCGEVIYFTVSKYDSKTDLGDYTL
jgi:tRNA(Ile2) C34 agmatinyltransferase TiaS